MADLREIKDYIKKEIKFIEDVEQIFSMFLVSENDLINRIKILELITDHNNIFLMKRKGELNKINEADRLIATKANIPGSKTNDSPKNSANINKAKPLLAENENVQIYMDLINDGLDIEEIMEDIFKKEERDIIISQILLRCYGELKIYNDLGKDSRSSEVQEEIKNIRKLIEMINVIRDIRISDINSEEDTKQTISTTNYRVAFYKTAKGNIDFSSDIKSIASEHYENFEGLLNSIINGQPIYWRKISNHGTLRGINEVKLAQCRIAYVFYDNYCIILQAFVKKTNVDMSIYRTLAMRLARFNRIKEKLISECATTDCENEMTDVISYLKENCRKVTK